MRYEVPLFVSNFYFVQDGNHKLKVAGNKKMEQRNHIGRGKEIAWR